MFEVEFINLINQYKNCNETYEKNKIKTSISNLIRENEQEFQKFLQLQPLDEETKNILNKCENNTEKQETDDDFTIIKNYFYKWLEIYNYNQKQITQENTKIVEEIINHYITHRYNILEKIFELKENEDFESFKFHIKNELRIYFIKKIENYFESNNYKSLNFFQKIRKGNMIRKELKKIGKYEFNLKELEETLNRK